MAAILRDSTVVVAAAVVRTRPRAIPLTMITMRKSTHGFPFVFHIWVAYGALLGGLAAGATLYKQDAIPPGGAIPWAAWARERSFGINCEV